MIEDIQPCGISSISDCVLEYIQKTNYYCWWLKSQTTTWDGAETLSKIGISYHINWLAGFLNHQQYVTVLYRKGCFPSQDAIVSDRASQPKPSWIPLLGRVTNPKCRSLGGGVWKMFYGIFFYPEVPIFLGNFSNFSSSESGIFNFLVASTTLWPGTPCSLGLHRSCRQITCVTWQRTFQLLESLTSGANRKPYWSMDVFQVLV